MKLINVKFIKHICIKIELKLGKLKAWWNKMAINDGFLSTTFWKLPKSTRTVSPNTSSFPTQYRMKVSFRITSEWTKLFGSIFGAKTNYFEIISICFLGLKFLVRICTDLKMPEAKEFMEKVIFLIFGSMYTSSFSESILHF